MDLYGGGLGIGKVMLILGSCAWGDKRDQRKVNIGGLKYQENGNSVQTCGKFDKLASEN